MSGRNDDAKEAKDIVYTGKEPFEKFDRQVNRWARRRFKGLHGHIWVGWTPMIVEMNSVQRCREIWRCLLKVSPKYATEAWKNEEEYSVEQSLASMRHLVPWCRRASSAESNAKIVLRSLSFVRLIGAESDRAGCVVFALSSLSTA